MRVTETAKSGKIGDAWGENLEIEEWEVGAFGSGEAKGWAFGLRKIWEEFRQGAWKKKGRRQEIAEVDNGPWVLGEDEAQ